MSFDVFSRNFSNSACNLRDGIPSGFFSTFNVAIIGNVMFSIETDVYIKISSLTFRKRIMEESTEKSLRQKK